MNKKISILLAAMMLFGFQFCQAADNVKKYNSSDDFDAKANEYNFENVSDEQLQQIVDGENSLKEDSKASFWSKIINSSHFSSGTATKTYIPINKIQ